MSATPSVGAQAPDANGIVMMDKVIVDKDAIRIAGPKSVFAIS